VKEKKRNNKDLAARMAAYATTALAALAVAHPASAAIVYSGPQNLSVPFNGNRTINLDGDANNDFNFSAKTHVYLISNSGTTVTAYRWALSASGLNGEFISYAKKNVMNLPSGYSIKNTLLGKYDYWTHTKQVVEGSGEFSGNFGSFNTTPGYMGIRFHANCTGSDNWNYGWISIIAQGSGGKPVTLQIVDWAYETNCNTPIKAGAIPPPEPVPTLDEWGMIALAALLSGTAIRRMKKGQSKV
jgi:hypothetical protein